MSWGKKLGWFLLIPLMGKFINTRGLEWLCGQMYLRNTVYAIVQPNALK